MQTRLDESSNPLSPSRRLKFNISYNDRELARRLNHLEDQISLTDQESMFRNYVGVAQTKSAPFQRWAKYREAYSHSLVTELIRRSNLATHRQFVLDPMCGSGSSLVASVRAGLDSYGLDVLPYAVDLTNAKIRTYSSEIIQEVTKFISKESKIQTKRYEKTKIEHYLNRYFERSNLRAMLEIRQSIQKLENYVAKHLLLVAWLATIEDCSNRTKDGNGLSTRRTRITSVWEHYRLRVQMFLRDIMEARLPAVVARAERGSALKSTTQVNMFASETGKELGCIVFSPPYANSFDYFESYKLELLAEYCDPQGLAEARNVAIRNYRKGYHRELIAEDGLVRDLCEEIRGRIPSKEQAMGKKDNRSRLIPNLLAGYFDDMGRLFVEMGRYTPSGCHCYLVVDQSAYLGAIVPTDLLLANIASTKGFEVEEIIYCGKATTSAQQLKQYPYLGKMLRTSIVSLSRS